MSALPTAPAHAPVPEHVPSHLVVDFDVYNPLGVENDLHEAWLRLHAPSLPDLVWSTRNGGHWLPTRGTLIAQLFADSDNFSNRIALLPREIGELHFGIPQSLDPPEHQPFRALVNRLLSTRVVANLETQVRAEARRLIEDLKAQGECDFVRDYAYVLPVTVFLQMVALPLSDREYLQSLNDAIIRPYGAKMSVMEASMKLHEYLAKPVAERRGQPGEDGISQLVNAEIGGRPLSDDEALNITKLVLQGGLDTVSNLMAFALRYLAEQPALRKTLIDAPERIPDAIEEFLRRYPLTVQTRIAKQDVNIAGITIKAGDALVLGTPLAGLDERDNPNARQFDLDREKRTHATFGRGIHTCPGMHLARLELRITLEEWLRAIPDFAIGEGPIQGRGGLVGGIDRLPLRWTTNRGSGA